MKLIADRLACIRGGRTLFAGLSFAVEGGEVLLLLGPNGAGKTTLIRMIVGLLRPDEGRIALDGGDTELSLGEQCHCVGHLNAVKSSLTVEENARFWCRYLGGRSESHRDCACRLWTRASARHPRGLPVGRTEAAAGACPGARWPTARSGCSTSRPFPSTAPPRTCSPLPSTAILQPAAWWWRRRMRRSASPKSRELHLGGTARPA